MVFHENQKNDKSTIVINEHGTKIMHETYDTVKTLDKDHLF